MILIFTILFIGIKNQELMHQIQISTISQVQNENHSLNLLTKKLKSPLLSQSDKLFILGYMNLIEGNKELATQYFEYVTEKNNKINSAYSYKILSDLTFNVDKDLSLEYAKKAFEIIPTSRYKHTYDLIETIVSSVLFDYEQKLLAISILEQVVSESNLMSDAEQLRYLKLLGNLYYNNENYTEAIETNLKIISLSDWIQDPYSQGTALIYIATVTRQIGAYEASEILLESIELERVEDIKLRNDLEVKRLIPLAIVKNYLGKIDESTQLIHQLDHYKKQLSDEELEIMNFYQTFLLAISYIYQNQMEEAQIQLQELSNYIDSDYSSYFVNVKNMYYFVNGLFYKQNKNYEKAAENFELILPHLENKSNLFNKILYYEQLIDVYGLLNDVDKETKYSEELVLLQKKQSQLISDEYLQYMSYRFDYDRVINERVLLSFINIIITSLLGITAIISGKKILYPAISLFCNRKKIRKYLENDNYFVVYQPIINPKTAEVMGAEALLRLKIDDQLIMPSKSIHQIESCQMMGEVTTWILKKVLDDYPQILASNKRSPHFYISLNLTFREIENNEFCETIAQSLIHSNVPKQAICLEITENIRGNDDSKTRAHINYLKNMGFKVALDDFGVEYSNFSLLDKFDFDLIKLDKYFIDHINQSSNKALIGVIYYLSKTKDVTIVVEGVENEAQQTVIKRLPLDKVYIQGYFYSKPLELVEFQQFIKNKDHEI